MMALEAAHGRCGVEAFAVFFVLACLGTACSAEMCSVLDASSQLLDGGEEHSSTYCACYLSALGREGLTC